MCTVSVPRIETYQNSQLSNIYAIELASAMAKRISDYACLYQKCSMVCYLAIMSERIKCWIPFSILFVTIVQLKCFFPESSPGCYTNVGEFKSKGKKAHYSIFVQLVATTRLVLSISMLCFSYYYAFKHIKRSCDEHMTFNEIG